MCRFRPPQWLTRPEAWEAPPMPLVVTDGQARRFSYGCLLISAGLGLVQPRQKGVVGGEVLVVIDSPATVPADGGRTRCPGRAPRGPGRPALRAPRRAPRGRARPVLPSDQAGHTGPARRLEPPVAARRRPVVAAPLQEHPHHP